ncbi:hypothetical protein [Crenalkalicoccus roseus]|uniref:hypothetical protein n=1 Tax=Crenalkalicoccus roseus TaxID=1485588 RepID=UPI001864B3C4|nr:hypothetical protein [Crenalkalicoccus roseus]
MTDAPPGLDLAALRARLLAERGALLGVSAVSAESRDPVELDQTSVGRLSRMDAIQLQAMGLATERRRDAAFARMEAGEYGWCAACAAGGG